MNWPRAILFDLDDTLILAYARPDLAWAAVTGEMAAALAPWLPAEAADAIGAYAREYWADPERGRVGRGDLLTARRQIVAGALERAAASAGRPAVATATAIALADHFTAHRDAQMRLHDGAHEVIDALAASGVKLALVTNGDALGQRAKIVRFALTQRFGHFQIEGEAGFGKPDERAYQRSLQALGVDAQDAWMVGDNLEWDVSGPQRLGIHAIWFDGLGQGLPPDATTRPDRIIRSLRELLA